MINILKNNERGMTLVEIIIAMALITLILAGAFVMFAFGNTTFRGGSNQRDIQADVRFALETLTNDVRYATKLEILTGGGIDVSLLETKNIDGLYGAVNPYETYIYYNDAKEMLVKLHRETMDTVSFQTDSTDPLSFSLEGTPASVLAYRVDGINDTGGKHFDVDAKVLMLNILDKNVSKASGESGGTVIRYMTPEDSIAAMQFPNTQLIGVNNDQKVEITFNKPVELLSYEVTPASKSQPLQNNNVVPSTFSSTQQLTLDFLKQGSKPTEFVDGDVIELALSFGVDMEYEAYYTLVYLGGSTKKWVIE